MTDLVAFYQKIFMILHMKLKYLSKTGLVQVIVSYFGLYLKIVKIFMQQDFYCQFLNKKSITMTVNFIMI